MREGVRVWVCVREGEWVCVSVCVRVCVCEGVCEGACVRVCVSELSAR